MIKKFLAYIDGSAYPQRDKFGIGGIITEESSKDFNIEYFSKKIPPPQSSYTAELEAARHVLEQTPPGSEITIVTDLLGFKEGANDPDNWVKDRTSELNGEACMAFVRAMARHEKVEVRHKKRNGTPQQKIAHHLAQSGATDKPFELDISIPDDGKNLSRTERKKWLKKNAYLKVGEKEIRL